MRIILSILIAACLSAVPESHASDYLMEAGRTANIDFMVENAISRNLISGGVVVIGNHEGIVYSAVKGRIAPGVDAPKLSLNTVFDVASLTKVVATTPAVMKLLDEGRINLMDPVTRWFPEFEGTGREDITILNLLTHSSGLDDMSLSPDEPFKSAIRKATAQKNWYEPGNRFRYADINFILLGELVRRVSGKDLAAFCRDELFRPMAAYSTMFLPPAELYGRIAPTLGGNSTFTAGIVQDYNARRLGGIAGHAGLFSSAFDLSRFAMMILGDGSIDGRRVLSERVVGQMTAPYFYSNGRVMRGLGWDIHSPYSAPRGNYFSHMSFGHTGYSGTSIWIDPARDLFVVLLTTRLNYHDVKAFRQLRSDISTLAVALFGKYRTDFLNALL